MPTLLDPNSLLPLLLKTYLRHQEHFTDNSKFEPSGAVYPTHTRGGERMIRVLLYLSYSFEI